MAASATVVVVLQKSYETNSWHAKERAIVKVIKEIGDKMQWRLVGS